LNHTWGGFGILNKKFKTLLEKVIKDYKHIIPEIVCSLKKPILECTPLVRTSQGAAKNV
jgi:hypothetical protein